MATKTARAKLILEQLSDPSPITNAMALRVADAFAFTYRRGEVLTTDQKAGVFIAAIRRMVKQVVADSEVSQGLEIERQRLVPLSDIAIGTDEI